MMPNLWLLAVVALAGSTSLAQEPKPATTPAAPAAPLPPAVKETPKADPPQPKVLMLGDKAPALTVGEWVKGGPVASFEKGKVYVVEFWTTFSAGSIAAMPKLTAQAKEHAAKGLTVIGMTGKEANNTLEDVKDMLKEKGEAIGYAIAWDKERATRTAWMNAAEQFSIPSVFIVNQSGEIAYIGSMKDMDKTLAEVVKGTFDLKTAAAKYRAVKEEEKERATFMPDYTEALKDGKGVEKAYARAAKAITTFLKDDADSLDAVAWLIVDPKGEVKNKDLDLALRAITRANELAEGKNGSILDTMARVYFLKGEYGKAVETERKAIGHARDEDAKKEMEENLREYEEAAKRGKKVVR